MQVLDQQDTLEGWAYKFGFELQIQPKCFILQRFAPNEDGHRFGTIDEAAAFLRGYQVGIQP